MSKKTKTFSKVLLTVLILSFVLAIFGSVIANAATSPFFPEPEGLGSGNAGRTMVVGFGGYMKVALQYVGGLIAVIILTIYGVQWFVSGPAQKQELKNKVWAYTLGAFLAFAGPQLFYGILSSFDSGLLNSNFSSAVKEVSQAQQDLGTDLTNKYRDIAKLILNLVTLGGSLIGVLLLMVYGIRWMLAGPEGRGNLKKESWSYLLGALLLFFSSFIAQLLYNVISSSMVVK